MNHISPIIHIIDSCIKPVFLRTAIDGYIMLMAELIAVKVFLRLLQTVYIPHLSISAKASASVIFPSRACIISQVTLLILLTDCVLGRFGFW